MGDLGRGAAALRRGRALALGWRLDAVALGLAAIVVMQRTLPRLLFLPNLTAREQIATPVAVIGAWTVAMLAILTAQEPAPAVFASAPALARRVNQGRVLAVLAAGTTAVTLAGGGSHLAVVSSGCAFTGEGLLIGAVAGLRAGWLLPTLHLLGSITVGNLNRADGLSSWAWVLEDPPGPGSVALSAGVLLTGCVWWNSRLTR